ncbi:MAG: peptidoglycan editing factor PgeF [Myxococcota bacterium]
MSALFIVSRLLPVPHGFSVREGGVSTGPFASLNLGFSVGDARAHVEENLARLARAANLRPEDVQCVSQVHGDVVLHDPAVGAEADALWTEQPGSAVGVKTADCVPILLVDPVRRRVAAVHSGWRGTDLEISARAIEALVREGSRPEDMLAAIGPAIQACCYEVSSELAERFRAKFGSEVLSEGANQPHLDLARAVHATLRRAGLSPDRIDLLRECTSCDRTRHFSHRRDRGRTGRHLSFVVCRF